MERLSNIRQLTADRLAAATYPPRRLALVHTGISLAGSLILMILTYLLSRQVADTGGLAGIGTRAALQSAQSVLSIALTVATPFWEFGFLAVAMGLGRGQSVGLRDLTRGFQRFGPVLRLILLQAILYLLIALAASQVAGTAVLMTPLGTDLMALMQSLAENADFVTTGVVPEEMMLPIIKAAAPMYVVTGILFIAAFIPVSYRLRLARYMLMDEDKPRALMCLLASNRAMKGNCLAFFKLDLRFWWYWLLQGLCAVIAFGDLWLPLVGVQLPFGADAAVFVFGGLQMAGLLLLAYYWRSQVETAYAIAYDELTDA